MIKILEKLKGGDLRSIGRSREVVQDIFDNPALFETVFEGLLDDDSRIRMRSADVLEKVSSKHPEYLQPFKTRLINDVSKIEQQEVRWHVAQMFSYLDVDEKERDKIIKILFSYIDGPGKSKIVKTFSIQTLADFAEKDEDLRPRMIRKLEEIINTGSPAMVSRGKKLIEKLKKN
ncbi:hypothetical protein DRO66_08035 [Candidatus Bathyarchaeota archaeon]|jgi:hypothetical protein|nr:MAG: hypothetical protein DRO66_08035 [Candidatus Bathyarchaeota archaeon]